MTPLRALSHKITCEIVATLMLTYCVAVVGSEIVLGTFQKPAFCRNVQTATYSMACATTAIATILISVTTRNYRKSIKPTLRNTMVVSAGSKPKRRGQVESVLLLLVESGVLYFLFFVRLFSLPPVHLSNIRPQAIQVVCASPRVQAWISTKPGVAFAFTMYSYCSSVIVVSPHLHPSFGLSRLSCRDRVFTQPSSSSSHTPTAHRVNLMTLTQRVPHCARHHPIIYPVRGDRRFSSA